MKKAKTPEGQRIEKLLEWFNTNGNAFAKGLGYPKGEVLYQIIRGRNKISRELAKNITKKYNQVNAVWLLTGDGKMIIDPKSQTAEIFRDPSFWDNEDPDIYDRIKELENRCKRYEEIIDTLTSNLNRLEEELRREKNKGKEEEEEGIA